ncbi:AAEL017052-PA [Aedes aegypti]|uniref:AAEL017052-PA n=1 Tax=Aedes aegypti TaxID=7159 RepID=J9HGG7_AEDAE|nr:AAEL017052-PA [Aedes aegypti]
MANGTSDFFTLPVGEKPSTDRPRGQQEKVNCAGGEAPPCSMVSFPVPFRNLASSATVQRAGRSGRLLKTMVKQWPVSSSHPWYPGDESATRGKKGQNAPFGVSFVKIEIPTPGTRKASATSIPVGENPVGSVNLEQPMGDHRPQATNHPVDSEAGQTLRHESIGEEKGDPARYPVLVTKKEDNFGVCGLFSSPSFPRFCRHSLITSRSVGSSSISPMILPTVPLAVWSG